MRRKIAHITDLHLDEQFPIDFGVKAKENWEFLLNKVLENQIKDVIFTGDIGTYESNKWFFDSVKDSDFDFKLTLGNHDLCAETTKYYDTPLTKNKEELYYTLEDDYYKYIFLDTSRDELSDAQYNWFLQELITPKKIILFVHHPILETGTTPQREYPLKGNEKIKNELLGVENEVFIFCGHLHIEDTQQEGNITQMITPAACYQIKKYSATTVPGSLNFGYRIIEITNEGISSEVVMFNPTDNNSKVIKT